MRMCLQCFLAVFAFASCNAFCPSGYFSTAVSTQVLSGSGINGFDNGNAADARFDHPEGLAVSQDGSSVLVADRWNNMIRKVDVNTGQVATIAGSGVPGFRDGAGMIARFNQPLSVTYFPGGTQAAVADSNNHMIRLIDLASDAQVSVLAGTGQDGWRDGLVGEATFFHPSSVAALHGGSAVVVADTFNHRLRMVQLDGWEGPRVTTLAGSHMLPESGDVDGVGTEARFNFPRGLAVTPDGMSVVVADSANHKIKLLALATGRVVTLSGSGDRGYVDGPGLGARFNWPFAVAVTADGKGVVVADRDNDAVRLVRTGTGDAATLAGSEAALRMPGGVAVLADGRTLVSDCANARVASIQADGCTACSSPRPELAEYSGPSVSPECAWECGDGHYRSGEACKACAASRAVDPISGECSGGFRMAGAHECHDLVAGMPCIECAWSRCGVGEYRTACGGASADGECAPCSNKPPHHATYTSSGWAAEGNDCQWECDVGFFIAGSSGGAAGLEGPLRCEPCSAKPLHAVFTSKGSGASSDLCAWECAAGFVAEALADSEGVGAVCRPAVAVTARLQASARDFSSTLADTFTRAVAAAAEVAVEHVRINGVRDLDSRPQAVIHIDVPRRTVEVALDVLVDAALLHTAPTLLTEARVQARFPNATVLALQVDVPPTALAMDTNSGSASSPPHERVDAGAVAAGCAVCVVVLVVGFVAVWHLRSRRRGALDLQLASVLPAPSACHGQELPPLPAPATEKEHTVDVSPPASVESAAPAVAVAAADEVVVGDPSPREASSARGDGAA